MTEETLLHVVYLSYPELAPAIWGGHRLLIKPMTGIKGNLLLYGEVPELAAIEGCPSVVVIVQRKDLASLVVDYRTDYLDLISSRLGLPITGGLRGPLRGLSDPEFRQFVKWTMAAREWARHLLVKPGKIYSLFEALSRDPSEFFKLYYLVREGHNEHQIFSAMLTFMHRMQAYQRAPQDVSPYYDRILRRSLLQLANIGPAIEWLMDANFQHELVYIEFYRRVMGVR